ncbi:MAG: hypothetical protein RIR31_1965 [Bacteroidota bacterium]|jgi:hypothetical protein
MKKIFTHIIILLSLSACKRHLAKKPVWLNVSDTVMLPSTQFEFITAPQQWKATLLTVTQPIQLTTEFNNGRLLINLMHKKGITEGPAEICLSKDKQYFYYPVYLLNDTATSINREYRSSKTVNPDSSLHQQRIVHSYDVHRNILPSQVNHKYFFEEEITLAPKVGIFKAIKNEPLTSYYIQAGSCTNIPVKATYKKETTSYYVTVGPLKDKYNNTVSNGTLVAFIYGDKNQTTRMEAALLNGMAGVTIPAEPSKHFTLVARVNETISAQINLIP